MNSWRSLTTLLAIFVWIAGAQKSSAAADGCPICGGSFTKSVYRFTRAGQENKVIVCSDCAKLETTCTSCGIPVKNKYTRLADGRMLCEEDAKLAVLTQDDADKIFDAVKRDVQSMLSQLGSLPHHNVNFVLEAKARLDKTGSNLISQHDDRLLLGLTRTTMTRDGGNEEFKHFIYALYGLTRERLMVVVAHEYGHAWIHENVKRKLNQDTHEGFCDWIGYKIISQKNAPQETKVLLESDYSRGQLQAFIAAEKAHGFYHVMNWVKNGMDPEIDLDQLDRVLVLRPGRTDVATATASGPIFGAIPVVARANPTNLVLKGLSGSATRRFAMINDGTFMANEQAKVRLGDSNVLVTCLQIGKDSVVVQVAGEAAPRTLVLKQ